MSRNLRIPTPADGSHPASYQPDFSAALGAYSGATSRLDGLDPVLFEVVRIRCARTHDCRLCKASRFVAARDAGVDESMLDTVDHYEQSALPERLKVALRYTDAFVTAPAAIDSDLRSSLHEHFTERELVELTLRITTFSIQKQLITLGLDVLGDVDMEHEVAYFEYDAHGGMAFVGAPQDLASLHAAGTRS